MHDATDNPAVVHTRHTPRVLRQKRRQSGHLPLGQKVGFGHHTSSAVLSLNQASAGSEILFIGPEPKADLVGGDKNYEALVARVVGFVEAPELGLDLPLDVRGTVFQQRVWQALREIPSGKTLSYAGIAQRIGSPKAVRAVASACAANNIALAIPCHRVVRSDGALAGYAWGVERKKVLIEREAAAA